MQRLKLAQRISALPARPEPRLRRLAALVAAAAERDGENEHLEVSLDQIRFRSRRPSDRTRSDEAVVLSMAASIAKGLDDDAHHKYGNNQS